MRIDNFASDTPNVFVADAGIVFTLWIWKTGWREAERTPIFPQKILLLEAEPSIRVIENSCSSIGGVRGAVGMQNLVHYDGSILLGNIGINGNRLQHAIGAMPLGLPCRAAVEPPLRYLFQCRKVVEILN